MSKDIHKKKHLSSFQLIILGFASVILLGAIILMLPVSSAEGVMTPFNQTLFTSTSAVCVTGLAVLDTGSYWSVFGQVVILLLIQIGGLGVVTVAVSVFMLSGRKISLMQRSTMQNAISAHKVGGIVRLTKFILKGTLFIEMAGALALLPVFYHDFGRKGIWMAVFHSISAFCNAGFDILGTPANPFPSITAYAENPIVNVVIMFLIIAGGIGFLTWEDICINKTHFRKYHMQSKIILVTTALLIVLPAVFFFFSDFTHLSVGKRLLASAFQAVTPRTAGFNTMDISKMTEVSKAMIIILMLVGGSPSSTAGGMKVTTFAVMISVAAAVFQKRQNGCFFGRRIDDDTVKNAATVFFMYISLFLLGGIAISKLENLPLVTCLYESASAVGTVGLTLGITPELGAISKLILIAQMYIGRVGGLTLIFAILPATKNTLSKLPVEKISVG